MAGTIADLTPMLLAVLLTYFLAERLRANPGVQRAAESLPASIS
jgi:hypothetical protein